MKCSICNRDIKDSEDYATSVTLSVCYCVDCFFNAKRSGVPQGCLPSANGSAGAGADAPNNSLISSVVPREEAEPPGPTALLPCPFCGQPPVIKMAGWTSYWWVGCEIHLDMESTGCGVSQSDYDKTRAIEKWNTRAGTHGVNPGGAHPCGERAITRND